MMYLWVMLAVNACHMDFNNDGFVTAADFLIFRPFINQECIPELDPPRDVASEHGVMLTWTAPSRSTDGSPLLDLDGYRIYCDELVFAVVNPPWKVDDAVTQPATCWVTALDITGNESEPSNSVTF